jgi:hypothetical protein
MPQSKFTPEQAVELAASFARHKVDYLMKATQRRRVGAWCMTDFPSPISGTSSPASAPADVKEI